MYLAALYQFYERMAQDPQSGMPPEGMSAENIHFVLVINENGVLVGVKDLRNSSGKATRRFVPASVSRSSNIAANFLWDKSSYVLGIDVGTDENGVSLTPDKQLAFRELHHAQLDPCEDRHAKALLAFLDSWQPNMILDLPERQALPGSNLIFQLAGDNMFLHETPVLRTIWLDSLDEEESVQGQCLITGRKGPILKVHPVIKGVAGSQTSGARLVSFTCNSFNSFAMTQGENAPVCPQAARGYTAALNYLLQRHNRQSVRIGNDTVVFWTEKSCPEESLLGSLFDGLDSTSEQQDNELLRKIHGLLTAMACGKAVDESNDLDTEVRFFVLGLSPNAARLGISFWVVDSLQNLLKRFGRWYRDTYIDRRFPNEPAHPALWQFLRDLAPLQKKENIPPVLGVQLVRSILLGKAWPQTMYTSALQRIHADKNVTYYRAALIKAHLCDTTQEGATMSLDKENTNLGYRLGRLFAILEKAQRDALGNVNASLRDRFIGSASTRPSLVFPQLLKNAQFHVSKCSKQHPGYDIRFAKLTGEIVADMQTFPSILSLDDQGRFMLGYYHQNLVLYQRQSDDSKQ